MKISNLTTSIFSRHNLLISACSVFLLLCDGTAESVLAADFDIEVNQVGIDGYYQVGRKAPLEFSIKSHSESPQLITPRIRVVDPDGHGVLTTLPEIEVGEPPVNISTLFRSGKIEAPIQIELVHEDQVILRKTVRVNDRSVIECLQQNSHMWMIDGTQPAYEAAVSQSSKSISDEIRISEFTESIGQIKDSLALESVELIVLNGDTEVTVQSSSIIQKWVERGGRLVIAVGSATEDLKTSPLSDWLPLLPTESVKIQNLSSLNQLVPGSEPLRFLRAIEGARFDKTSGQVLVSGLETPLVIRAAYGLGHVTMISIRLDQKPLSTWESRAELALLLAGYGYEDSTRDGSSSVQSELNPTGVTDLQTQLIHTLDDYQDIDRPSYWVAIGWGSLLLLIIGPIDYFLVHHLLGRPQLTWVTLTLWITGITFWTYNSASSTNSSVMQTQQIELIDVDMTTQKIRGHSWFNFYSPATKRYQVKATVRDNLSLPEKLNEDNTARFSPSFLQTSWVDRPETSYRGMYRSGGIESNKPSYRLSNDHQSLPDLPVRVYSTGLVGTEWESQLPSTDFVVHDLVDPGNRRLKGQLTYHGQQEISDWFVAYGNFAYFPRTARGEIQKPLRPGDEFDISNARSNLLRGVLIGLTHNSTVSGNKMLGNIDVNREIYDPLARVPFPILRTLSFHEVTGGTTYTQLNNQSLQNADLSHLIELQRAVLFGRIETPVTNFSIDESNKDGSEGTQRDSNTKMESVIRIILPVEVDQIDVDAPPDPSLLRLN